MTVSPAEIKSVLNFRDAGGMPAVSGRRIRKGMIFRSASPDRISRSDIDRLHGLNIRTIVDLRAPYESRKKSRKIDGIETVSLPLDFEKKTRESLIPLLKQKDGMEKIPALIDLLYLEILDGSSGVFREVVRLLIDPSRTPLLIHCQAGKDRTGVICALLQMALEADRNAIIAGYMISNERLLPHFRRKLALRKLLSFGFFPAEKVLYAVSVRENNINSVIDRVINHYGGIEAYLSNSGQVNSELEELQKRFLI